MGSPAGSSPRVRGKLDRERLGQVHDGLIPACAGKTRSPPLRRAQTAAHPRVCGENLSHEDESHAPGGSSPRVRGKPDRRPGVRRTAGLIPACAGKTGRRASLCMGSPAHPRVCGENVRRALGKRGQWGSSPRVRGKLGVLGGEAEERGLIPACAGKTPPGAGPPGWRAAHPRVCGENPLPGGHMARQAGSSPRVRGKLRQDFFEEGRRRLIPACAGKTTSPTPCGSTGRAHPRVCGENLLASALAAWWLGSSPRVRGKRQELEAVDEQPRLIPACAGKTDPARVDVHCARAHPRVCGENSIPASRVATSRGSSPRVRGKLGHGPCGLRAARLIPACAGKTRWLRCWSRRTGAHPRVCGENKYTGEKYSTEDGSSPRVRGKPGEPRVRREPFGLIPACAGKTGWRRSGARSTGAHPRVCGENSSASSTPLMVMGSSPRVRGKRSRAPPDRRARRLIPACAGKTRFAHW